MRLRLALIGALLIPACGGPVGEAETAARGAGGWCPPPPQEVGHGPSQEAGHGPPQKAGRGPESGLAASWLNEKDGPRPEYVWESREDMIYHETWYPDPDKLSAPEFWALMRCPWVFNRAMRWLDAGDGTVIACCEAGDLPLTGAKQVSRWYSDPANEVADEGNATRFVKKTAARRRDCAVLPSFQFHPGQHPRLRLTVSDASDPWQFVASIKGRSGAPFICSGWQEGPHTLVFDIAAKLRDLGYLNNYAELHLVIGTWAKDAGSASSITFAAELVSQPALVACLPVIRTSDARSGVHISAVVIGDSGRRLTARQAEVVATVSGQRVNLKERDGIWTGTLGGLGIGNHEVFLSARAVNQREPLSIAPAHQIVRVTDGEYCRYDPAASAIRHHGKVDKPMTGSFQGTFFCADAGLPSERPVKTQADWDNWDRGKPPGEHLHYWESLTDAQLDERFRYLAENGWDLLHLHSHFGIWERFDAFGHPAPHGVEQLAAYVRAAERNGLHVMVTLSSYPYSVGTTGREDSTTPYAQTLEAGFKNEDWYDPAGEPFNSQYRRYLRSMVGLFRDETGIFSWSSSGEGDWKNGLPRFLDTKAVIRSVDAEHILVSEPIHKLKQLPASQAAGFTSELIGDRNYNLGGAVPFEQEMGLVYRFNRMLPNAYLAEGSFPSSYLYVRSTLAPKWKPYVGRPEYRRHVRDTLYLGLVHRMPILMTWDEAFTEDERRILAEVKRRFDWAQPMEEPAMAILVSDADSTEEGRQRLAPYEEALTHLPLDYRFIASRGDARRGELVIDPKQPFDAKAFQLTSLPEGVRSRLPLELSKDYAASYCVAADRRAMLAYLYNTSRHTEEFFYLGARYNRMPAPADLRFSFLHFPPGLTWRLYDLNDKRLAREGCVNGDEVHMTATDHDYLLWVGQSATGSNSDAAD